MSTRHPSEIATLIRGFGSGDLPHRKNAGRRERRAAETRLKLFRCALQLFSQRGVSNVTVEDITEAADVGKGTFFNYFESKDHLLGVFAEVQLGKVGEAVRQAEADKKSIASVLHQLFLRIAEEPGRSPELARALLSSFVASEHGSQIMGQNMAKGREAIARIIHLGQQRHEIDPTLNADRVALHLQQVFLGTLLVWSVTPGQKLRSTIDGSFENFWRAVAARK